MPCYNPLQAYFVYDSSGNRSVAFSNAAAACFYSGGDVRDLIGDHLQLPCGRCIGCRLERSRQWAMRIMHEASLYDDNCFVTLTYDGEHLPKDGSLVKKDFQDFMKRLRKKYVPVMPTELSKEEKEAWLLENGIRFFHCGEYGEDLGRPHYHACLFNLDFYDKRFFSFSDDEELYVSQSLTDLWGKGHCTVGSLTFKSSAYVARYCLKKINGEPAEDHYKGKLPEYCTMSNKPGIGRGWYEKFKKDAYPSDYLIVNGAKCKPPRYYDTRYEIENPEGFLKIKEDRVERAKGNSKDNTYRRLKDREYCKEVQVNRLIRPLEGLCY